MCLEELPCLSLKLLQNILEEVQSIGTVGEDEMVAWRAEMELLQSEIKVQQCEKRIVGQRAKRAARKAEEVRLRDMRVVNATAGSREGPSEAPLQTVSTDKRSVVVDVAGRQDSGGGDVSVAGTAQQNTVIDLTASSGEAWPDIMDGVRAPLSGAVLCGPMLEDLTEVTEVRTRFRLLCSDRVR